MNALHSARNVKFASKDSFLAVQDQDNSIGFSMLLSHASHLWFHLVVFWKSIVVKAGKNERLIESLAVRNLNKQIVESHDMKLSCHLFEWESLIEERIQGFSVNFRLKFPFLVRHQANLGRSSCCKAKNKFPKIYTNEMNSYYCDVCIHAPYFGDFQ